MNKAFGISLIIHFSFLLMIALFLLPSSSKKKETFNFTITEKEIITVKKKPKIVVNASKKSVSKEVKKKVREVFGGKRKSLVDNKKGTTNLKVGNTLTKKEDNKILRDDEDDSLPEAADEFLITAMPRAINEIRPKYPKWAKDQKISGSVVFEILIDQKGKVRSLKLLKGIHPKLDTLAKEALSKFEFRPAFIKDKPVAVRINYAIRYNLEV